MLQAFAALVARLSVYVRYWPKGARGAAFLKARLRRARADAARRGRKRCARCRPFDMSSLRGLSRLGTLSGETGFFSKFWQEVFFTRQEVKGKTGGGPGGSKSC
eukprot:2774739-Alexandrium_andersonii.AAC.1